MKFERKEFTTFPQGHLGSKLCEFGCRAAAGSTGAGDIFDIL